MSNCVDPDETAHYELSHLDLCCLQKPILSPMAAKELATILMMALNVIQTLIHCLGSIVFCDCDLSVPRYSQIYFSFVIKCASLHL